MKYPVLQFLGARDICLDKVCIAVWRLVYLSKLGFAA